MKAGMFGAILPLVVASGSVPAAAPSAAAPFGASRDHRHGLGGMAHVEGQLQLLSRIATA